MIERLTLVALAVLTLLSLWFAPWASINREIGARSAVLLLPNRVVDFTGRTDPVEVPGQRTVLIVSALALLGVLGATAARGRGKHVVLLVAGGALIATTAWGLTGFDAGIQDARLGAVRGEIQDALDRPRDRYDLDRLEALIAEVDALGVDAAIAEADDAGLRIRRLPYGNSGFALAAFLAWVTGALAIVFGLRAWPRYGRALDRWMPTVAVPLVSILLALAAAAVVVLILQPTPVGRDIVVEGAFEGLVGRLDTLWYAYLTLFQSSLGTAEGFFEALKFATPLIFTGLGVAFGFQAGLFNIGAPGQMVLGAVAAMLVGVYVPGPAVIVLPLAVAAAAVGGGLWGALPGWLKARFGANEVINTILLNFVASALLLFLLSSNLTFAQGALRIIYGIGVFALVAIAVTLVRPIRRASKKAPRVALATSAVFLLAVVVFAGWPRAGDGPVTLRLPFKVEGSEPKSQPIREEARLAQLPDVLRVGSDPERPDSGFVPLAAILGVLAGLIAIGLVPRFGVRRLWPRIGVSVGIGAAVFGLGALFGIASVELSGVPPSRLNVAFLIALGAAVFMQYFLWRTKWGYELRAVGQAPEAAEYGGASIANNIVLAMAMSGAFAGLTATHYVLGGALEDFSLRQILPTNDGFDGIAVALLGANQPVGIVLSAFLFGVLKNGGSVLNITFPDLTRDVVNMILALVVLFIAAKGFLPERFTDPIKRRAFERQREEASEDGDSGGGGPGADDPGGGVGAPNDGGNVTGGTPPARVEPNPGGTD